MVEIDSGGSSAPVGRLSEQTQPGRSIPFTLTTDTVTLAPRYIPGTFRRTKQRELNRKENFCGGENVSDRGQKNWEIHAVGRLLNHEVKYYDRLVESGDDILLTSLSWSGEVKLEETELEGPVAWDPIVNEHQWEYTMDLVSTGRDEAGNDNPTGILDDGTGTGGSRSESSPYQ